MGIGAQRLHGRTGLPLGHGGAVLDPVGGFLTPAAHGGHHPAVVVHNEDGRLGILLVPVEMLGEIAVVGKNRLDLILLAGDLRGINPQAAVIDHILRVFIRIVVFLHQVLDDILDE